MASTAIRSTRARPTPTSPTWRARGGCSPRPTRSSRSSRPTTRTRSRRSTSSPAPTLHAGPVRVPVPARHGRAAVRAGRRRRSPRASSARPCRIYAPVGTHETLLAYLVRRLLENGANTSFVNRIADASVPIEVLVEDPVTTVERIAAAEAAPRVIGRPHPAIALPHEIYGAARRNSRGLDLSNEDQLAALADALRASRARRWTAAPLLAESPHGDGARGARRSRCRCATLPTTTTSSATFAKPTRRRVERALASAAEGAAAWAARRRQSAPRCSSAPPTRSRRDLPRLLGLLAREAGKTVAERHRGSARGGRLPPLLRRAGAARPRRRRRRAARPGRLHQPMELPARDLHRPGCRCARRRQSGPRQARRADAADRRRDGAPPARRRRSARRAAAAARPRRDGRRCARRRRARRGRHVHRLDRGRPPAPEERSPDASDATAGPCR